MLAGPPLALTEAWKDRPLAVAYLAGEPALRPFYVYPCSWEALPAVQQARRKGWQASPQAVAAAIEPHLLSLFPHPAVLRSLDHLASGQAEVVVAGQQPGFLGGPLYTFYKALTVIRWARSLTERTGRVFVPVFWVASEDDDFEEIATAWLLDGGSSLRSLRFQPEPDRPVSVGKLQPEWAGVRSALEQILPDTEFRADLLAELDTAYRGRTLAEGFAFLLLRWFAPQGLLVVDPMWPPIRRLIVPLLERVLEDPLRPTRLVNEAGEALTEAGFSPQIHKQERLCPFYIYGPEGERRRLVCQGDTLQGGEERWNRERLQALLHTDPERFSLSLILRPVAQDYLFPTAVFAGGPGEVAYFAQLRGVYQWLGVAMPLVMPRFAATLVEPKVERVLRKYDLGPHDLRGDVEALLNRLIRERFGEEAQERFLRARHEIEAALAPLSGWVESVDANLAKPTHQLQARVEFELEKLLEKTVRALKRQHEILVKQVHSAADLLYPRRQPQERVLNPYAFWVRYGPPLREAMLQWPAEAAHGQHLFLQWDGSG